MRGKEEGRREEAEAEEQLKKLKQKEIRDKEFIKEKEKKSKREREGAYFRRDIQKLSNKTYFSYTNFLFFFLLFLSF